MQNMKVNNMAEPQSRPDKFVSLLFILTILLTLGMLVSNWFKPQPKPPAMTVISHSALEEKYGLRVNLVAVTGAGGFVDVRIKIVDGEKAKLLLSDKKNFPALWINEKVTLNAPEDTKSQKIRFDDGGNMFIMYPNLGNAVLRGMPVKILFGDTALEPINAE